MNRIISWNVNGIRAVHEKGFAEWLKNSGADLVCVQETKAQPEQLKQHIAEPEDYKVVWASAKKKGYSGVATYYKQEPEQIERLGSDEFDDEGRTLILHYPDFSLINCYFPNSQSEGARLGYKLDFCAAVLDKCNSFVGQGKNIVLCGDYNIAHKAIDLKNPKRNEKNPGYLPEERAWMDTFTSSGYVDTFRQFNQEPDQYTWWSYRFQARQKNIGWRIDYHCVNEKLMSRVKSSVIHPGVLGSDHCPIAIEVE